MLLVLNFGFIMKLWFQFGIKFTFDKLNINPEIDE